MATEKMRNESTEVYNAQQKVVALHNVMDTIREAIDILNDIDDEDFLITIHTIINKLLDDIHSHIDYLDGEDKFMILKMFHQINNYVDDSIN